MTFKQTFLRNPTTLSRLALLYPITRRIWRKLATESRITGDVYDVKKRKFDGIPDKDNRNGKLADVQIGAIPAHKLDFPDGSIRPAEPSDLG